MGASVRVCVGLGVGSRTTRLAAPDTFASVFRSLFLCFSRQIVGRGSFGTVYKAKWQNQYVALKEFYMTADKNADQKAIQTEVGAAL